MQWNGYGPIHLTQWIQQYRGLGVWSNKREVSTKAQDIGFQSLTNYWQCGKGSGNQKYRIVTEGYAEGVNFSQLVQPQNYLRVTCP